MDAGAGALLDGPIGTFDFTDVIVGRNNVKVDGKHVVADTLELSVGVDVADDETADGI